MHYRFAAAQLIRCQRCANRHHKSVCWRYGAVAERLDSGTDTSSDPLLSLPGAQLRRDIATGLHINAKLPARAALLTPHARTGIEEMLEQDRCCWRWAVAQRYRAAVRLDDERPTGCLL